MSESGSVAVTTFIDAVWLEDGLAANTLAAYRRDLTAFEQFLREARDRGLDDAVAGDIEAWFAARHAQTRPSTANRRLATLRRYYAWALRHQRVVADPCLNMVAARQPLRVPKVLSESQVEALLQAPPLHTTRGFMPRGCAYPNWSASPRLMSACRTAWCGWCRARAARIASCR